MMARLSLIVDRGWIDATVCATGPVPVIPAKLYVPTSQTPMAVVPPVVIKPRTRILKYHHGEVQPTKSRLQGRFLLDSFLFNGCKFRPGWGVDSTLVALTTAQTARTLRSQPESDNALAALKSGREESDNTAHRLVRIQIRGFSSGDTSAFKVRFQIWHDFRLGWGWACTGKWPQKPTGIRILSSDKAIILKNGGKNLESVVKTKRIGASLRIDSLEWTPCFLAFLGHWETSENSAATQRDRRRQRLPDDRALFGASSAPRALRPGQELGARQLGSPVDVLQPSVGAVRRPVGNATRPGWPRWVECQGEGGSDSNERNGLLNGSVRLQRALRTTPLCCDGRRWPGGWNRCPSGESRRRQRRSSVAVTRWRPLRRKNTSKESCLSCLDDSFKRRVKRRRNMVRYAISSEHFRLVAHLGVSVNL